MKEITRNLLANYYRIIEENQPAKYIQSKYNPVEFSADETVEELWKKHVKYANKKGIKDVKPKQSLLDLKVEIANRIFKKCVFCENKCQVDRTKETGTCNVKKSSIASEFPHLGEEQVLVPSHTIFFSGCTFKCVYCQNWDISQKITGLQLTPKQISKIIKKRYKQGAKNVNWVGGDPTPNIPFIIKTLQELDINTPQIFNSNIYCSEETMKLLQDVIDLYLTDFKYGNNKCAKELSKVEKYIEIVTRNHKIAYKNAEVIIRHLVLPNHIDCCSKPIIDWIAENTPNTCVNIMGQYKPDYQASEYKNIARPVLASEVKEVKKYAEKLGLYQI